MTKLFVMATPILPGKTEQWKKFTADLNGRYKNEYNASRKKAGVYERTYLQTTPTGDLVITTMEGENPTNAIPTIAKGTDEFTKWFINQVKEIHGFDMSQNSSIPTSKLYVESTPVGVLANR